MKKVLIIGAVLTLFILILGAATNPSYAEYKEWYKQQANDTYKEYKSENNEAVVETTHFENSLMGFFADMISDTSVIREDHKFYSLYTIDSESFKYKVLGVFNNFYILEDVTVT
ncbi:MAG: hypothetical protein K0R54_2283, partial [Clostridiaceae bacterium]|nr:hypothetical protein [Clostridiaceae bacterium]